MRNFDILVNKLKLNLCLDSKPHGNQFNNQGNNWIGFDMLIG